MDFTAILDTLNSIVEWLTTNIPYIGQYLAWPLAQLLALIAGA